MFNPNQKVKIGSAAPVVFDYELATHNPVFADVKVWDKGPVKSVTNPVKERAPATKFKKGRRIQKGSLTFFANVTWECLSKTKCGQEAPTGTANAVWGPPVRTK